MIYNISTKFNATSYISWGTDLHWAHIIFYNPISTQIDTLRNVWKSKKLLSHIIRLLIDTPLDTTQNHINMYAELLV